MEIRNSFIDFLHCLHSAIVKSEYTSVILKPKQVLCLEAAYLEKDLLAVLPTGYGKSLVFYLLSSLLAERKRRSGVRGCYRCFPTKFADTRSTTKDKSNTPKSGCIGRKRTGVRA
jgi:hypothetical protein